MKMPEETRMFFCQSRIGSRTPVWNEPEKQECFSFPSGISNGWDQDLLSVKKICLETGCFQLFLRIFSDFSVNFLFCILTLTLFCSIITE